ncbi:hypothetical protein [Paenibacillus glacialis]|uniref:Uncharacterized protein n=1 Tax=Paenibacillus glacialis TaxID=494026 RepID=A0A168JZB5_9BACL|nr:hypothetical protein [Paenibacillus glacialis]OAB41305.1 hypothetical protein PGLA_15965 [Paenibacillus glacialis]
MKKVAIFLTTFLIASTLFGSIQSVSASSNSTKVVKSSVASKKVITDREMLAYYNKMMRQIDDKIRSLRLQEGRYAKSSQAYRDVIQQEIDLMKKKEYWLNKAIDLLK